MLIGLLSDTHDQVDLTMAAVQLLRSRGAEQLLHCGDVGSARVLDQLAGLSVAFVWGNCDQDRHQLQRYAEVIGLTCCGAFGQLEIGGRRLALMHGDDAKLKRRILTGQQFDYLCFGHTHAQWTGRVGRTLVVNPGALHGVALPTVALLETATDSVEFLIVK